MKMRSLLALAISGVLVITTLYSITSLADEMSDLSGTSMQEPADNVSNPENTSNNLSNNNTSSDMSNLNMDEGSPDVASGDDDY